MLDREKHLKVLEELRKTLNVDKGIEFCEEIESLDYGLNVMRKYEKIEQIIADWKSDGGAFEMSESYWLKQIIEVVENGNKLSE